MSDLPNTFATAADFVAFATAGRAVFTATSAASGAHFTYRISAPAGKDDILFVSVMHGDDSSYLGVLRPNQLAKGLTLTAKSKAGEDAPSVKAFRWFWTRLMAGVLPSQVALQHEGKCGKCRRALTNPESMARGIGPECFGKVSRMCEALAA